MTGLFSGIEPFGGDSASNFLITSPLFMPNPCYFDVFYYTIAIANEYGIELEKVFELKDKINQEKYEREFSLEEGRENYKKKIYKKSGY